MKVVWYCSEDLWASIETTECKECGADMKNIGWFEGIDTINLEEVNEVPT
jgi:hypothetical protein